MGLNPLSPSSSSTDPVIDHGVLHVGNKTFELFLDDSQRSLSQNWRNFTPKERSLIKRHFEELAYTLLRDNPNTDFSTKRFFFAENSSNHGIYDSKAWFGRKFALKSDPGLQRTADLHLIALGQVFKRIKNKVTLTGVRSLSACGYVAKGKLFDENGPVSKLMWHMLSPQGRANLRAKYATDGNVTTYLDLLERANISSAIDVITSSAGHLKALLAIDEDDDNDHPEIDALKAQLTRAREYAELLQGASTTATTLQTKLTTDLTALQPGEHILVPGRTKSLLAGEHTSHQYLLKIEKAADGSFDVQLIDTARVSDDGAKSRKIIYTGVTQASLTDPAWITQLLASCSDEHPVSSSATLDPVLVALGGVMNDTKTYPILTTENTCVWDCLQVYLLEETPSVRVALEAQKVHEYAMRLQGEGLLEAGRVQYAIAEEMYQELAAKTGSLTPVLVQKIQEIGALLHPS